MVPVKWHSFKVSYTTVINHKKMVDLSGKSKLTNVQIIMCNEKLINKMFVSNVMYFSSCNLWFLYVIIDVSISMSLYNTSH